MRDHSRHIEMTREEAVAALLSRCAFEPQVEEVAVTAALGRTLAADVVSQVTMPSSLTCRMDSVAVRFADFEAGMPDTSGWAQGEQWQFANTGVAMPEGFDTAFRVEDCDIESDDEAGWRVAFHRMPREKGEGTKPAGADLVPGDLLARAGSVLTPLLMASVASGGNTSVPVLAKPRVAFIPTGNELVPVSATPPMGKNLETNSVLIAGKIEQWGGCPRVWPIIPDDRAAVRAAIQEAVATCDIVVINAGSSKGSDDWTCEVLEDMGEVLCHETNHGPGHHSSMAVVDGKPIVGISGPPLGASFTTDFYLLPVMLHWFGKDEVIPRVKARLTADFPKSGPGAGKHAPAPTPAAKAAAEAPKQGNGPEGPGTKRGEARQFFSVQQLRVERQPDGSLAATPIPMADGMMALDNANAFFRLYAGPAAPRPQAGDEIEVELRWPYVI